MVRLASVLMLLASPVLAWEFNPTPICTLIGENEKGEVRVTYDPTSRIYEISLTYTVEQVWDKAQSFTIEFLGSNNISIATNRHMVSNDGKTLAVKDTGFGNVLDGLEFNQLANAQAGSSSMPMSLEGAAEPVQAFRACGESVVS